MRDLIGFIREVPWEGGDSGAFSELALRSFRLQCESIPEYGTYARHRGPGPDTIRDWREIPPVPASAFRSHDLSARAEGAAPAVTFETSGTTISLPGRVRIRSTELYEASLARNFARHVLPDQARLPALVFGPTRAEAPRSSLWFMVDHVAREQCAGATWIVEGGDPRWERADLELARAVAERRPVLLLGTTLLFHAYFARCAREGIRFTLPAGSRAMDTGGAKGTRIELGREEVLAAFARVLGIPPSRVVNEYGMAEMGSQFYQDTLVAAHDRRPARPGFVIPPWVRTRVLDPETMRERSRGVPGLLVHYDLANLEIPLAIQTEDIGSRVGDRLHLEGRLPDAEARGCSLQFEQFLERERSAGRAGP
jgi:acyl-protein synthetase LuxE